MVLCEENEGDCDSNNDCEGDLICGSDNCLNLLSTDNFTPSHDCCYAEIKCGGSQINTGSCCTSVSPCGINEGDCDDNFECQGELMCGIDNCINILSSDNFPSTHDCCYSPCVGSQTDTASCCTSVSPCGINEGDCDENFECQGELMCGIDNCINILPSDNFPSTHDCCFTASKCGGNQTFSSSCCTSVSPCGINEGDCDDNFECQGVLVCGIDNCINILPSDNFPSSHDCCYSPFPCDGNSNKDIDSCCRTWNPCGENEGDCDSDADCHDGLVCGINNCRNILAHQKYEPTHDCCHDPLTTIKCDGRQANAADCCKFFIMSEEFNKSFQSEEPIFKVKSQYSTDHKNFSQRR